MIIALLFLCLLGFYIVLHSYLPLYWSKVTDNEKHKKSLSKYLLIMKLLRKFNKSHFFIRLTETFQINNYFDGFVISEAI